ncbi:hypothetical protein BG011_002810 [Mortierella polycephala]|uniref:Uncharacterized protein n=1 Tax=Mortierella polycephala TaxID=41804 RepID=A0A9P6Q2G6_9FUNG|nr:hypothetical protein BG011_002810 [Mortierella polycephala]
MTNPRGRGNVEWWGTCASGFGCHGPCDSKKAQAPILNDPTYPIQHIRRGEKLTIEWNRFNHPGGFVRLAMVPFEKSDEWASFNAALHSKFTCYETNCGPDDPNDSFFGVMNGAGNGICSTTFTVPQDLPDGKATLQWIWYGGGVYYGQADAGFGEYYTCADYVVQGGQDLVPGGSLGDLRVWQGGDASNPGADVCKYWSSNRIGDCSFGEQRPPNPKPDDLLSQSLEPCAKSRPSVGKAAEFEPNGGSWRLRKR